MFYNCFAGKTMSSIIGQTLEEIYMRENLNKQTKVCCFQAFTPSEYHVVWKSVVVRKGRNKRSEEIGRLEEGTILYGIQLHDKNRLKINKPIKGWVSLKNSKKYILVERLDKAVNGPSRKCYQSEILNP